MKVVEMMYEMLNEKIDLMKVELLLWLQA
jgi:hypothetical protein